MRSATELPASPDRDRLRRQPDTSVSAGNQRDLPSRRFTGRLQARVCSGGEASPPLVDQRLLSPLACSINFATGSGCDTITTCDAPGTTMVFFDFARSAMKPSAFAGMFLSWSP